MIPLVCNVATLHDVKIRLSFSCYLNHLNFTFSISFPTILTFSLAMFLRCALYFQSPVHFPCLRACFLLCFCPHILISCYVFTAFSFTIGKPITTPSPMLITFILPLALLSNIRTFYTHGRHNIQAPILRSVLALSRRAPLVQSCSSHRV